MLIIIKDAAKFNYIEEGGVCICVLCVCMENKHIKVTECSLDKTTKLGGAGSGELRIDGGKD